MTKKKEKEKEKFFKLACGCVVYMDEGRVHDGDDGKKYYTNHLHGSNFSAAHVYRIIEIVSELEQ